MWHLGNVVFNLFSSLPLLLPFTFKNCFQFWSLKQCYVLLYIYIYTYIICAYFHRCDLYCWPSCCLPGIWCFHDLRRNPGQWLKGEPTAQPSFFLHAWAHSVTIYQGLECIQGHFLQELSFYYPYIQIFFMPAEILIGKISRHFAAFQVFFSCIVSQSCSP